MLTRSAIAAAALVALGGSAFAADISQYPQQGTYSPPPAMSPVYSPASMVTADVSLAFGGWWYHDGLYRDSGTFLDADGRLNVPLGNTWNLMPEVYVSADLKYSNDALFSGILHFYKNLPNTAIGPFIAVTANSGGGPSVFTIGGEARMRALGPNVALTGQASFNTVNGYNFGQFGGLLDFYITPESKFTAALQVGAGSGQTVVEGSAMFTHHLPNTRFNLFAAVQADSYGHNISQFAAKVGATVNFGQTIETIADQDNNRPFHFVPIGGIGAVER